MLTEVRDKRQLLSFGRGTGKQRRSLRLSARRRYVHNLTDILRFRRPACRQANGTTPEVGAPLTEMRQFAR